MRLRLRWRIGYGRLSQIRPGAHFAVGRYGADLKVEGRSGRGLIKVVARACEGALCYVQPVASGPYAPQDLVLVRARHRFPNEPDKFGVEEGDPRHHRRGRAARITVGPGNRSVRRCRWRRCRRHCGASRRCGGDGLRRRRCKRCRCCRRRCESGGGLLRVGCSDLYALRPVSVHARSFDAADPVVVVPARGESGMGVGRGRQSVADRFRPAVSVRIDPQIVTVGAVRLRPTQLDRVRARRHDRSARAVSGQMRSAWVLASALQ